MVKDDNTIMVAEGEIIIRNFGINLTGIFMYDKDGQNIDVQLPKDSLNKKYRLLLEEIA